MYDRNKFKKSIYGQTRHYNNRPFHTQRDHTSMMMSVQRVLLSFMENWYSLATAFGTLSSFQFSFTYCVALFVFAWVVLFAGNDWKHLCLSSVKSVRSYFIPQYPRSGASTQIKPLSSPPTPSPPLLWMVFCVCVLRHRICVCVFGLPFLLWRQKSRWWLLFLLLSTWIG